MNADQINAIKEKISQREAALKADIRRELELQDNFTDIASELADPGDVSFADLTIDLGNAAVTRDVNELRDLQAAKKRIGGGTYGNCRECGLEIPFERLEVQPAAERCTPCQDMYEKTHAGPSKGATM